MTAVKKKPKQSRICSQYRTLKANILLRVGLLQQGLSLLECHTTAKPYNYQVHSHDGS